ncbi:MAG: hypothetical protein RI897_633 [Verrucomicrobiota bacterium]
MAETAEGVHGGREFTGGFVAGDGLSEGGFREAWGHAIHTNLVAAVGSGGGAGEPFDASLGGGDGLMVGEAAGSGDCGAEDDGAALLHHAAGGFTKEVEARR